MSDQVIEFEGAKPKNPTIAGKLRAKRIKALTDAGATVDDYLKEGWDLVKMSQDTFDLMVQREAEATELLKQEAGIPKPEFKADKLNEDEAADRIRELEKKVLELSQNNSFSQELLDSIVEKKLRESGMYGVQRSNEQELSIFKEVTKALEGITLRNEQAAGYQAVRPVAREQVDIDDVLDSEVYFFAYGSEYTLFGDKRKGQDIRTPYGTPIKFTPSIRVVKNAGSRFDKSILAVCVAKIISKKELAFLKSHTLFNVTFYETAKDAASVDVKLAELMAGAAQEINNMTQHQVVMRAKYMNLPLSQDIDAVRRSVIDATARQRMAENSNKVYQTHPTATAFIVRDGKEVTVDSSELFN